MVALTGTGRLADDIYLLAHHEVSGKPFLQPRALGLGLAAGLLAEPVLIRAIRVSGDGVAATSRVRPQDGLMRAVHLRVLGERQRYCTGSWLSFLLRAWPRMSPAGSRTRGIWSLRHPGVHGRPRGGFLLMRIAPSRH